MPQESQQTTQQESALEQKLHEVLRGDVTVKVLQRDPTPEEADRVPTYPRKGVIVEITVATPEGKEMSLQKLLPEGWLFVQIEELPGRQLSPIQGDHAKKTIQIPRLGHVARIPGYRRPTDKFASSESRVPAENITDKVFYETHDFFKMRGSFLTLLHEVGHTQRVLTEREDRTAYMYSKRTEFSTLREARKGILAWDKKDVIGYLESIVSLERDAWAYSLEQYRSLLAQGADVEPDMSQEELFDYIRACLHSYLAPGGFESREAVAETEKIRRESIAYKRRGEEEAA